MNFFDPLWDFIKNKSEKILKKILRKSIGGTLSWKTYLGGPKEKIWKKIFEKKYFQFFFRFFFHYIFFQSQVGLFQKKFWKNSEENSEKINRGTLSWKTYLGGPKEKIWKKKIWKKLFSIFFKDFSFIIFFSISSGTFSKFEASSSIS